jgi:hypothetical protein
VFGIRIKVLYIKIKIKMGNLTRPKGLYKDKNRVDLFYRLWFRKDYINKL